MKGGPKQQTTQTQANTYAWQSPPESADVNSIREWKPQIDPSLSYSFGRARRALSDSFDNPQGAYTTPAVRDAQQRAGNERLAESEAQAMRGGYADVNNQEMVKRMGLAELTNPRLVQTGGSSTGTSQQSGGLWPSIIGGAAGVGAAGL